MGRVEDDDGIDKVDAVGLASHLRETSETAQVVLRKILPKRLTITPTPGGGWRFHGVTNYTEVLKECGYDAVSHVLDEMISKLSKRRA